MDKRSLNALEYDKVLNILASYCVNSKSKERALNLTPIASLSKLTQLQDDLDDTVKLFLQNGSFKVGEVENIIPLVERAQIESTLNIVELLRISSLLRVIQSLLNYYHTASEENSYPIIDSLFRTLTPLSKLEREISRVILDEETIADNASPKLFDIRRKIKTKNESISRQLDRIINSPKNEKALQDKIVSMRGGRYVVPVKENYRSQIPGVIVDRSATGATIFIEPVVVLELNNELRELEIEESKEIERILKDLTAQVAEYKYELEANYNGLIDIDFLFAKANFALDTNSTRVEFDKEGTIDLRKARHPLIPKEKVVASTIELDPQIKTLVITGPNTGGKTVVLKTMGLLSALAQSGLFIPVASGSRLRLFKNIYADIGDEQSIEQNLSTFSSHMTNIVRILSRADKNSLVLFDELGSGTDPIEGAALAVSILENTKEREILTFATTHYAEIKEYALTEKNVLNASVEFDVKTLKPTYRLLIGLPGKSNAFEIASRLGLPKRIIENSKKRVSTEARELDETIDRVQEELRVAESKRKKAEELFDEAEESKKRAKSEEEKVHSKADKILEEASDKARKIVDQTQKETREIYKEIQKIQKSAGSSVDNKTLETLRAELNKTEKRIEKNAPKSERKVLRPVKREELKKGDRVFVRTLNKEAEVLNIPKKGKTVEVRAGSMRLHANITDLETAEPAQAKVEPVYIKPAKINIETRLDLRGKTSMEAEELVDALINQAILAGETHLEIIHGFGTGQIRRTVHEYLRKSKYVSSYRLGGPGEGGAGATIVEL